METWRFLDKGKIFIGLSFNSCTIVMEIYTIFRSKCFEKVLAESEPWFLLFFFKSLYHFPYFTGKKNILYTSSQKDASKLSLEFLHHDPSVLADNLYFHHSFPAAWLILSGMWQRLHLCTFLYKVISVYQFKAGGTEASYNLTGNSPTIYVQPD